MKFRYGYTSTPFSEETVFEVEADSVELADSAAIRIMTTNFESGYTIMKNFWRKEQEATETATETAESPFVFYAIALLTPLFIILVLIGLVVLGVS